MNNHHHLWMDGSLAAREERYPAPLRTVEVHPHVFQGQSTSEQDFSWPCLHVKPSITCPLTIISHHATALTYVRMVRRQHATIVIQRFFTHCKRIRVSSKVRVRQSKVGHGCTCTSNHKSLVHLQSTIIAQRRSLKTALTYLRMVRRQHAALELQRLFTHRKRIRMPSKCRVHRSKVVHDRACTSSKNIGHPLKTPHSNKRIALNAALTYAKMVRRQLSTIELQRYFTHRKRIRMSSERRVRQ
jgi:hypothetical protein